VDLPAGIRDLSPADLLKQEQLKKLLLAMFGKWGYAHVSPPSLESLETLQKSRPQLLEKSFKVIDSDSRLLALRPDLTLPIARLAASKLSSTKRPLRLCYASTIFSHSSLSTDSKREIPQAGIELIGSSDNYKADKANLECLMILLQALTSLQITEYKIVLSHSDFWDSYIHKEKLGAEIISTINQKMTLGDFPACQEILQAHNLDDLCFHLTGDPDKTLLQLEKDSSVYRELENVLCLKEIFGADKFLIDFTLRPDKSFYTGIYFELIVPGFGQPIGYGGRYDDLLSCFGKDDEDAVGFSIRLDALLKLCQNLYPEESKTQEVSIEIKTNSPLESLRQALNLQEQGKVTQLS